MFVIINKVMLVLSFVLMQLQGHAIFSVAYSELDYLVGLGENVHVAGLLSHTFSEWSQITIWKAANAMTDKILCSLWFFLRYYPKYSFL